MRDYLEVAVEAAKLGGDVLKRYYGQKKTIEYKGEIDIVTEVDRRSEKLIVDHLASRFPGHSILAEEGTHKVQQSEFKWVIDPLDGTTNYAHDYPFLVFQWLLRETVRSSLELFTIPFLKNSLWPRKRMVLI